ncbi:MAG: hypothetical protein HY706_21960 [Candidatus Hydrogenedentes bacterium]|nr:hypothetical protein [Candidatus Hydrogenedentota bacterium]
MPLFLGGLGIVAGFVLLFEESTPGDLLLGSVVSVLIVGGGFLLLLIAAMGKSPDLLALNSGSAGIGMPYAGFWPRTLALLIDALLFLPLLIVRTLIRIILPFAS